MSAVLDHSNDEYRTRFARRTFASAFGGEIVSLLPGTNGQARVSLADRGGEATIHFKNGICVASKEKTTGVKHPHIELTGATFVL
ncbi:MAG: hypothetical protein IKZ87_06970 [Actinomycetaceae bacterium]|nr:hypothetical protein [Actinomycetaceae bacterium]